MTLVERIKAWRQDDTSGYDKAIRLLCEAEEALVERDVATKKLRKAFDDMLVAEVHRYGGIPHLQPVEVWFRDVLAEFLATDCIDKS